MYIKETAIKNRYLIAGEEIIKRVMEGRLETIKLLLDAGSDINFKDQYGNTALHYAAMLVNFSDIYQFLAKHGAREDSPNNDGLTPSEVLHLIDPTDEN